jgi:AraC-like DNA-binding protein
MLPFAPIDLAIAARLLRKSRRTLQRRLAGYGTSFEDLLARVRANLALLYLGESSLTVGEIAEILRFSETSAFSRFLKRTYGKCPRQIRNHRRGGSRPIAGC